MRRDLRSPLCPLSLCPLASRREVYQPSSSIELRRCLVAAFDDFFLADQDYDYAAYGVRPSGHEVYKFIRPISTDSCDRGSAVDLKTLILRMRSTRTV